MAARITQTLNEEWRSRIQASMLINRLNDHIFNGKRLEATQLKAIEILLRKVAPDLAQIEANITERTITVHIGLNESDKPIANGHDKPKLTPEAILSIHESCH